MGRFKHRRWLSGLIAALSLLVGMSVNPLFAQTPPLRIGILGDSSVDEYRTNDQRGGTFGSVTFNWLEQLVRSRNITAGAAAVWGEPRRAGYEYNWARSATTAQSVILQGQHTGLARQSAQGQIDLAVISVGNQDFAPYVPSGYKPIYDGTLTDQQVQTKVNLEIQYITTAVDTVLAARRIPMIATLLTDFSSSSQVLTDPRFTDPIKRQRVSNAIAAVNNGIRVMAQARGILIFDPNAYGEFLNSQAQNGVLNVSGVNLNLMTYGDDPHNGVLGDAIHIGTIMEGFFANQYVLLINQLMGTTIPLLTDHEILAAAGLAAQPNAAPVAQDDAFSTGRNDALTISYSSLTSNDSDANQDALNVIAYTQPLHGLLTASAADLIYTPAADYIGTDNFTYTISDGHGGTASAAVTITIYVVNHAPLAAADSYTTIEDTVLSVAAQGVLSNDTDADGNTLTAELTTAPTMGSVTLDGDGSFTYTPNADAYGSDSFTYHASDGITTSDAVTVTVTITPVNDAPVARGDSFLARFNKRLTIKYGTLLGNDFDVDGDTPSIISYTTPTSGILTKSGNSLVFRPLSNWIFAVDFTYTISDGHGGTSTATVRIRVRPR